MIKQSQRIIFIDPSSEPYYNDKLFTQGLLNRDGCLEPFIRLRQAAARKNIAIHTADKLFHEPNLEGSLEYYSLGILKNYQSFANNPNIKLKAFVIFEPPVVAPEIYHELPKLTQYFEKVYIHNTIGDGYSLTKVDASKLAKLYWPQPFNNILPNVWNNEERLHKIVIINGNHKPNSYHNELYSKRIQAMSALSRYNMIDLYGRNWDRWWSRSSLWWPYWKNFKKIMAIYKGPCESKYQVLSKYIFSLCFENMAMDGYFTEKLFDCLYAGTIPIYMGSKSVVQYLPPDIYIDSRIYKNWAELVHYIKMMTNEQIKQYRIAGKKFLQSGYFKPYYCSLEKIFNI